MQAYFVPKKLENQKKLHTFVTPKYKIINSGFRLSEQNHDIGVLAFFTVY